MYLLCTPPQVVMISERAIYLVDTNAPQDLMLFETTRRQDGVCSRARQPVWYHYCLNQLYIRSKVDVHTRDFVFSVGNR